MRGFKTSAKINVSGGGTTSEGQAKELDGAKSKRVKFSVDLSNQTSSGEISDEHSKTFEAFQDHPPMQKRRSGDNSNAETNDGSGGTSSQIQAQEENTGGRTEAETARAKTAAPDPSFEFRSKTSIEEKIINVLREMEISRADFLRYPPATQQDIANIAQITQQAMGGDIREHIRALEAFFQWLYQGRSSDITDKYNPRSEQGADVETNVRSGGTSSQAQEGNAGGRSEAEITHARTFTDVQVPIQQCIRREKQKGSWILPLECAIWVAVLAMITDSNRSCENVFHIMFGVAVYLAAIQSIWAM
ncbi:hypothetical protein L211DRAFT_888316 [Terfezia boudieri ATCC MYA-4762]|uniref:Uncharacterized protein n=1 Tax=Terfezia boudieri ATCC MYA-4762 TaxID=1051890 RepID=A0A3N4LG41_9PEZI|nr:hypothetical protein L211DRAFT_888316 [Terfezia boudieri ATCC MYA-4762]